MKILEYLSQPDSSGKFSKESWLIKNNLEAYNSVINYCIELNLDEIKFNEKVYLFINQIKSIPKCSNNECSNKTKFKNKNVGYNIFCSKKCQGSSLEIKDKKKNTNLKKYGTEHPILNDDINKKFLIKINNRTKEEQEIINSKRKLTNLEKFGVDNPNKLDSIKNKRIESFKLNIDKWKYNYRLTSIKKYNTSHPWSNKDIYKKVLDTNIVKYGTMYPMQNNDIKNKSKKSILDKYGSYENINRLNSINNYNELLKEKILNNYNISILDIDRNEYKTYNSYSLKLSINPNCDLHDKCDITYGLLLDRIHTNKIICTLCNDKKTNISSFQLEVYNFIKTIISNEIIFNDRIVLEGKEIDIFIPKLNIGIECNGVYWHSESFKGKNYHRNKYISCNKKNIKLIQIWEDDWYLKKDIIKSRLSNLLHNSSYKIGARKCDIRIIDSNTAKIFLNTNHLQGFIPSKYYYGLLYNNELVSVMTFGSLRRILNQKDEDKSFELLRFANKLNHNVVGSASKLFNYFIKNVNPTYVVSYANLEWGKGDFYNNLGFKDNGMTDIGYYYIVNGVKKHRYNYTKDKLIREGYDKMLSEYQIMLQRGYDRIWTTGNQKWVWLK